MNKHPNCPNCTTGLKYYKEACYSYWASSQYHIEKLYRLYFRNNNGFKPFGWYCKKCNFMIPDCIQKNPDIPKENVYKNQVINK